MKEHWVFHLLLSLCFLLAAAALLRAAPPAVRPLPAAPAGNKSEAANVRLYGAIGDGATDDTDAIQRAVDQTRAGRLEFPRGNYRLTRTIEIRLGENAPTAMHGQGGAGRVTMAGAGPAFRFIGTHTGSADPASFKSGGFDRERMPVIDQLEIVGAHPEADGVEFFQVMQPTLSGVLIREVRHGVHLVTRNRNVLLTGCHIYNCRGVGVFFDRVNLHQAIISACHISYCKGGGIKVAGSEIRNLQITGNDIEYNYDLEAKASADIWIDVTTGSVREGTIASNTIQAKPSPGGANIRFTGSPTQKDVGLWSISGNLISSQNVNVHLQNTRGVVLSGNTLFSGHEQSLLLERCRHIVVAQQVLDRNPDYKGDIAGGIVVRDCDGVILQALQVSNCEQGTAQAGGVIEVLDSRETTISGCQIFEPKFRGIYVRDSRNTRIGECLIMEREGADAMLAAVEIASKSPGTVVQNNQLGAGTRGTILGLPVATANSGNQPAQR